MKILIIQTAFLGDVILTLPLAQAVRRKYPDASIHMVVIPAAENIIGGSPVVDKTIRFDKKGEHKGVIELVRIGRDLRKEGYGIVLAPHRSLRTALLVSMTGARIRIGFRTSALPVIYTTTVPFNEDLHEADRNLQLLRGLDLEPGTKEVPELLPSKQDAATVDAFFRSAGNLQGGRLIAIAPGSVWYTKRWPADKYAELVRHLEEDGWSCVLIGGREDESLAENILSHATASTSTSAVGLLSLVQSAELIRRCHTLITNDSAPLHLGVAMRTRVIAIFGPTVTRFGFAPYGVKDRVVETHGLECRPCTKHGGPACPIGTFECMEAISPAEVARIVRGE